MRRFVGILFLILFACQTVMADDDCNTDAPSNYNMPVNNQNEKKVIYNNEKGLNLSLIPVLTGPVMPDGIIYKEIQTSYSAINPQKTDSNYSYYPGLRGPNQLVIYTPMYGHRGN